MRKRPRLNAQIRAPSVRVIDKGGKQVGVLTVAEALAKARQEGLDLVEVAPNAKPPVVRVIDFKKYEFQKKIQERKSKKSGKTTETKELRFGPNIGPKDLEDRAARAKEFLKEGNKVKITIQFKGRQITHPEIGMEKISKLIKLLAEVSEVEQETKRDGRFIYTILKPK